MSEPKNVKVKEVNPPSKKEADQKIKELSKFLSSVWNAVIKTR